jgi:hypothetical protein
MSEIKLTADSGGGSVSWKGPASTTSNAAVQLTLPVNDGDADQVLTTNGSGALSWAAASGGKILQVVANNVTGTAEYTLDYYGNAGDNSDFVNIAALNTSITTTAANSNILVNLQFCGEPSNDDKNCRWVVNRTISGTTTWFQGASPGSRVPCTGVLGAPHYDQENSNSVHPQTGLINYFDDIGTVSAGTQVDYKLMMESGNGSITYNLNKNEGDTDNAGSERTISYFTLMEVSA